MREFGRCFAQIVSALYALACCVLVVAAIDWEWAGLEEVAFAAVACVWMISPVIALSLLPTGRPFPAIAALIIGGCGIWVYWWGLFGESRDPFAGALFLLVPIYQWLVVAAVGLAITIISQAVQHD